MFVSNTLPREPREDRLLREMDESLATVHATITEAASVEDEVLSALADLLRSRTEESEARAAAILNRFGR